MITAIHDIQGNGSSSPIPGASVTIQGIVTAWMPQLKGFYVQQPDGTEDADPNTSEGIFVYYGDSLPNGFSQSAVGDLIEVTGVVGEFQGRTQLDSLAGFSVVTDNVGTAAIPAPVSVTLPMAGSIPEFWERYEGMLVTVTSGTPGGKLVVTDTSQLGSEGQVTLTSDAVIGQFTETHLPSVSSYAAWQSQVQHDQIVVDDGSSAAFPNPETLGRGGDPLSTSNPLRAGDGVVSVTGIVDESTPGTGGSTYRIEPTQTVDFQGVPRPTAADVPAAIRDAEIKVASVSAIDFFTTLGGADFTNPNGSVLQAQGADTSDQLGRQLDKIAASLLGLDADVIGLTDLQNNGFGAGSAIATLVDKLNSIAGAGVYAYISGPYSVGSGSSAATAGDDATMVAIIYKPGQVTPVGAAAVPDIKDPAYAAFGAGNGVPVAQTFRSNAGGEEFTLAVNHFMERDGAVDPAVDDGQGAGNAARVQAAQALTSWLATDPTGAGDADVLLVGDFNAYALEDPVRYLESQGWDKLGSGDSYSALGAWGSLDHAFASGSLAGQVAGAYTWAINAQEPAILDWRQSSFYAPDAYRSSDHNPILIGLNLDSGTVLAGTAGNDSLSGGVGNDTLDGGAGRDTMAGGAGDDTYFVDQPGDRVVENPDEGHDLVHSTLRTTRTPENIEDLFLDGAAVRAVGNGLDNLIVGNAGANDLRGEDGNDTLAGGGGNDRLQGGRGADTFLIEANSGHDRICDLQAGDTLALAANINGSGIVDMPTLLQHAAFERGGALIDLGGANDVLLMGVRSADALSTVHVVFN